MPHVNELHEQHDQILVVSLASGDLAPDDRDRATAQTLVDSCAECARLHDDIVAIARATRALPPAVRTRDFQLSPETAARLRPGGWRRLVAGLSAPGSIFSRQLGLGLATLGIAGLLFSAAPAIQLGMGGSAAASPGPQAPAAAAGAPESVTGGAANGGIAASPAASAAAASAGPAYLEHGPAASSTTGGYDTMASEPARGSATVGQSGPKSTAAPTDSRNLEAPAADGGAAQTPPSPPAAPAPAGPSGIVILSTVLLVAGLLVLLLRSISRRFATG
jgi:hypothetical protein